MPALTMFAKEFGGQRVTARRSALADSPDLVRFEKGSRNST